VPEIALKKQFKSAAVRAIRVRPLEYVPFLRLTSKSPVITKITPIILGMVIVSPRINTARSMEKTCARGP